MREVALVVARGRDALVDLVDRRLRPRHLLRGEIGEHGPRCAAATDGERERPVLGHRRSGVLGHIRRRASCHSGGVGKDLDRELGHDVFSTWPPNCLRIAERSLSANSSWPREENRE